MLALPLLIIPLAIFNIVVFLTPGISWDTTLTSVQMISGATWTISLEEAFVAFSLFILFFEILKSTRVSSRSLIDHMLSMLIFVIALVEFLLVPQAGNSTFGLLLCIMLLDVVAGFSVAVRVAQRDVAFQAPS